MKKFSSNINTVSINSAIVKILSDINWIFQSATNDFFTQAYFRFSSLLIALREGPKLITLLILVNLNWALKLELFHIKIHFSAGSSWHVRKKPIWPVTNRSHFRYDINSHIVSVILVSIGSYQRTTDIFNID